MNVTFRAGVATPQTQTNQPKPTEEKLTNVTSTLNPTKPTDVLVDKNYGSLQVKQMKVAFKGLPAPLPKGGPSLGEKITGLFDILKSNEVILVGKNMRNAIKDLETHLDEIDNAKKKTLSPFRKVIKKIFFVEDKSIENTMGFTKNGVDKEFTNMSKKVHFINDAKTKEQYFIKPHETIYLSPNDSLRTPEGKILKFNANTKAIPNKIKEEYAKVIDMTEETEPTIKQINKRNLKRFSADPAKAKKPIMFSDVGGMNDAIQQMKEVIVYPIKHPEVKSPKNMNKAILLEGPPGTGKSLLGEATANESQAYYRYIKGSELDSKFVGESEANVRAVVDEARQNQPAIIFIDEIDAVAQKRDGNSDTYGKKVLNTWLAEISESEKRGDDIYFIAATNNKNSLDPAMTRAGRFGQVIHVGLPDEQGVKQIFDIHRKGMPFDEKFNIEKYSKELHKRKASGSDIASAVEDAERFAKRREGIYEKIDKGTYKPDDMKKLRIKDEDFDLALKELEKRKALEAEQLKNNDLASEIAEYKALNKERREEIEKLKAQQAERNKPRPQIGFNADRYKDRKSND